MVGILYLTLSTPQVNSGENPNFHAIRTKFPTKQRSVRKKELAESPSRSRLVVYIGYIT